MAEEEDGSRSTRPQNIEQMEHKVDDLKAELTDLQVTMGVSEDEKNDLENQLLDLRSQITELIRERSELLAQLQEAEDRETEMKTKIKARLTKEREEKQALQSQIVELESRLTQTLNSASTQQPESDVDQDAVQSSAQVELDAASRPNEHRSAEDEKKIESLNEKIRQLQLNIEQLEHTLKEERDGSELKIEELNRAAEERLQTVLNKAKETVKSKLLTARAEMDELKNTNRQLLQDLDATLKEKGNVNEMIEKRRNEWEKDRKLIGELENKLQGREQQISSLEDQLVAVKIVNEDIERENKTLSEKVAQLKKELQAAELQIGSLKNRQQTLESELGASQDFASKLSLQTQQLEERYDKVKTQLDSVDSMPSKFSIKKRIAVDGVSWCFLSGIAQQGRTEPKEGWWLQSKIQNVVDAEGAHVVFPATVEEEFATRARNIQQDFESSLNDYKVNLAEAQKELEQVKDEFKKYKVRAHSVLKAKSTLQEERDGMERELESLRTNVAKLTDKLASLEQVAESSAALQQEKEDLERELVDLKEVHTKTQAEVYRLKDESDSLQREYEQKLERLNQANERIIAETNATLAEKEHDLRLKMDQLEQEFSDQRQIYIKSIEDKEREIEKLITKMHAMQEFIQSEATSTSVENGTAMSRHGSLVGRDSRAGSPMKHHSRSEPRASPIPPFLSESTTESGQPLANQNGRSSVQLSPLLSSSSRHHANTAPSIYVSNEHESPEVQILHFAQVQAQRDEELNRLRHELKDLSDSLRNAQEAERAMQDKIERLQKEKEDRDRAERREIIGSGLNLEYLKNIVLKFVETGTPGSSEHEALLPVLFTLLQFSPEEVRQVQESRTNASGIWSLAKTVLSTSTLPIPSPARRNSTRSRLDLQGN
eukprot:GILK01009806.1.p1 GENE.GILK01009806.1~~GILK01009806.1.p1  ORF type:complete len:1013 (-),score=320.45 GILK01009806.1:160-2823(-)